MLDTRDLPAMPKKVSECKVTKEKVSRQIFQPKFSIYNFGHLVKNTKQFFPSVKIVKCKMPGVCTGTIGFFLYNKVLFIK